MAFIPTTQTASSPHFGSTRTKPHHTKHLHNHSTQLSHTHKNLQSHTTLTLKTLTHSTHKDTQQALTPHTTLGQSLLTKNTILSCTFTITPHKLTHLLHSYKTHTTIHYYSSSQTHLTSSLSLQSTSLRLHTWHLLSLPHCSFTLLTIAHSHT